jgi:outer membrane protein assembly factor BamB
VSDGERIVSYFGSCGLFCYDLAGKELWNYPLPPAATVADFGTGVSPLLVDGVVVLLRDESQKPMLLAVDAKSGAKLWETKRESISGFGTPAVWKTDAGTQIVAPGYGRMIAYDLKSGEEVWSIEGMPSSGCTTPVVFDDLLLYAGWSPGDASEKGGFKMPTFDELLSTDKADADGNGELSKAESQTTMFKDFFDSNDPNKDGRIVREEWDGMLAFMARSKNSAFAVTPGGRGDVTQSHVKWRQKTGLPYVPTAICYDGKLIMVKDGGIVTAYDALSGDEFAQFRLSATGGYYASPVAAHGHIYFTSLQDGTITVLELKGKGFETLASNPPLGERVSATPAIAEDTLYVRTAGHLYAFAKP